ncbi:helix-turn-helix transcriptional regulator [Actinospica durhamensis]|uniref:Helix-turn-helix transcriptional regulator n=1 Tax=Actinospica durhamensis TaxID=1508375 RepID=A0A941EXL2_9ACTN|nr:helix-turn-helix transcriptional regulator [Actinospica durhamensis]MBR7839183.1 helix-turn-helix transcriptional regulator [Actinospica durhamensis]
MRDRMEEKRWSYGDVARRGGISKSTVHHLVSAERPLRMLQSATLRGLARGLELPLDVVRRAAAQSVGIYMYEPESAPEVDLLIASLQQLSDRDRQHVAALVESLLRHSQQADEDEYEDEDEGEDGGEGPQP